ncbi:helix-turn-helix domain-containing protein [Aureisphaera galaxeae]|uniref:AraC family transcriptional regulator n=1 Tax=Aureisphaera galaxeae TaxID=1538023 RepID=UPI0023507FCA|nr:helix-turn-helix domain-containing protein [Aureisphaera galaxeae]MDC8005140.1 helix-turn-helix domain-containing protein [Aureisphaera galaxeae]
MFQPKHAVVQFYRYPNKLPFPDIVQGIWGFMGGVETSEFELISDGYPEMIFMIQGGHTFTVAGQTYRVDSHSFIGQIEKKATIVFDPNTICLSVKLMPWALPLLTNDTAKLFKNQVVHCEDIMHLPENLKTLLQPEGFSLQKTVEEGIIPFLRDRISRGKEAPSLLKDQIRNLFSDVQRLSDNETAAGNYSARYLEKAYQEYVGISPKKYRRLIRIKKASLLLSEDMKEESVAALALALGYFDQSHFYKDFLMFTETSPSKFMATTNNSPVLTNQNYRQQWEYS